MLEVLIDIGCAVLLAALATALGTQLLPRLKYLRAPYLFLIVFAVTLLVGLFATPLGTPLYDAIVLIVSAFVSLRALLLIGARRGHVPSIANPDEDPPTITERRWAALGAAFSFAWFAALFLALVGLRWAAYD